MRLLFWNVMRLGASTDDARRTILSQAMYARAPHFVLLCELTTASTIPHAQNITYRRQNSAQLCYGAFDADGDTIHLTRVQPVANANYHGLFSGGNNFANLVDRALAYAGTFNGYEVFVIHSPAYQFGAERAITYLRYALDDFCGAGNPWLVVGDFNIEPANTIADVQDYIVYDGATYVGGLPKAYDYVLTNRPADVSVETIIPSGPGSDHMAIEVQFF